MCYLSNRIARQTTNARQETMNPARSHMWTAGNRDPREDHRKVILVLAHLEDHQLHAHLREGLQREASLISKSYLHPNQNIMRAAVGERR